MRPPGVRVRRKPPLASLLAALTLGCGAPPPPLPDPAAPANPGPRPEDELTPLARATRALERGELDVARAELEGLLEDEPDDHQARYLYARTLAAQGQLRGARAQVRRALEGRPTDPLLWSLRADVEEQLGEHRDALAAYAQVNAIVPESLDPLLGMARCQLFLGLPGDALVCLDAARARPGRDPWIDYLRFVALRRLGRSDDAEAAGRGYLEKVDASQVPALRERAAEVRAWLGARGDPIAPEARQVLVDAVRAGLRLRLPGAEAPEDEVLARGPSRLLDFDERPVFVTVTPPAEGAVLRGRGRGRSLAAALKGALLAIQEQPGYTALAARDAAVRIEVGRSLEAVALRDGEDGALAAAPPVVPGRHGVAVRLDGQELVTLPADVLGQGLDGLEAMLRAAAARAGLAPDAWRGGAQAAFRFETDAWLSPSPGVATLTLAGGEPLPLPGGTPGEVRAAARDAARWLTTLLAPAGDGLGGEPTAALAPGHDAAAGRALPGEARLEVAALGALALARAHAATRDPVLLAAAEQALARVLARGADAPAGEAAAAAPWTLRALRAVADLEPEDRRAALRAREAGLVAAARAARGAARPPAAVALLEPGDAADAPGPLLAGLALEGPAADPVAVEAAALAAARGDAAAWARALAWARAEAARPAPDALRADEGAAARARRLAARVRVAALAAARREPDAAALRAAVAPAAADLLALQLAARHRGLLRDAGRALGGFRRQPPAAVLEAADTAEAALALLAAAELLGGP